jgi:glycosyltransferase involved in cell wall biosynthesis
VLVLPSTAPEPFGLSVVEALACGVPVVATAAGGPLEILGPAPGEAGRLVPPGDAAALAAAVVSLLHPEPSSTALRRDRPVLRSATAPGAPAAVFDRVLESATTGKRRHRGTAPRSRRRTGPN